MIWLIAAPVVVYLSICIVLYVAQDVLIFPLLYTQRRYGNNAALELPPEGVYQFFATTTDGKKINVWTTFPPGEKPKYVGMVFHGNGETVSTRNFLPFFANLGVPAFTFDYRGYGLSTGWPYEKGIYKDAEAVWHEIQKRTGIDTDHLLILANSIGSGPAAYLANKLSPRALIMIAAYADLPSIVATKKFYSLFTFVLRYEFPVAKYLRTLKTQCVILAHGKQDGVIPFSHLSVLEKSIPPGIKTHILVSDEANHANIYYKVEDKLYSAVASCLE